MTKISELTSIVTAAATDIIAVVQGGVTKKVTVQDYIDEGVLAAPNTVSFVIKYNIGTGAVDVTKTNGPSDVEVTGSLVSTGTVRVDCDLITQASAVFLQSRASITFEKVLVSTGFVMISIRNISGSLSTNIIDHFGLIVN